MLIQDHKKIEEIKNEFNNKFPCLKLEFYAKKHEEGEGSSQKELLDQSLTVGEVRTFHNSGELSINGHLKVSTLEKNFAEMYGLNVQVFRRSHQIWLQTTATDSWTLSEQNKHGEESMKMA